MEELELQSTCLRYLLSVQYGPPQTAHHDFQHNSDGNPIYFLLVTETEETTLSAFPGPPKVVYYPEGGKRKFAIILKMGAFEVSKYSVLVVHGYLQHVRAGSKEVHALQYHTFVIPEGAILEDAVALSCGVSLQWEAGLAENDLRNCDEDGKSEVSDMPVSGEQGGEDPENEGEEYQKDSEDGREDIDAGYSQLGTNQNVT